MNFSKIKSTIDFSNSYLPSSDDYNYKKFSLSLKILSAVSHLPSAKKFPTVSIRTYNSSF